MVSIQIIKILRKEEKQMKKLLSLVLIGTLVLSLLHVEIAVQKTIHLQKKQLQQKKKKRKNL